MKKNTVLIIICAILVMSSAMFAPEMFSLSVDVPRLPVYVDDHQVSASTNINDFVDALSDLHAPTDIGTHSAFANMQAYDSTYDTLTEEDMGVPTDYEDFVDALSDLHDAADDFGTHSAFAELQDKDSVYDTLTEGSSGSAATNYQDFVDQISDLHTADTDIGTHSSFAEMQDKDGVYDTLTEGNTGTANQVAFVSAGAGASGTTTTIAPGMPTGEASGYLYLCHIMVLGTTVGVTSVATSDPLTFTLGLGPYTSGTDGRIWIYYAYSDGSEAATCTVTTGTGTVGRLARIYMFSNVHPTWGSATESVAFNSLGTVSTIVDTGVTTTGTKELALNFVSVGEDANTYVDFAGETGGDWTELVAQYSNAAGEDGTLQIQGATMAAAGTVNGGSYAMGASDPAHVIGLALKPQIVANYDMDLEVGWTAAPYSETNEYLCIYGGTQGAESLVVDVWTGAAWTLYFSDVVPGWNNLSISSYLTSAVFEIRFTDISDEATLQDAWEVEGVLLHCWSVSTLNYDMDLEVGWTAAPYSEADEYLCVYGGTQGAEALRIDIWNAGGSAWVNVISDVAVGWNNVSIATYLTDATVEVRLTDTSDDATAQETWELEALLLHSWSDIVNYQLDLEVGWTAADYDENNEELCIYAGTLSAIEDIGVAVWTGSWTTIDSGLSPSAWNNYSVASYLTSAAFEIRFFDSQQSGDTGQTGWQVDAVLLHCWSVNSAPANDQAATCADLTETDNFFAEYQDYSIIAYVSDANGYADIDYIDLSFYSDDDLTLYWTMRYDEDTNTFSEQSDASDYVEMGSSSASRTGNDIDATFEMRFHWGHPDVSDIDVRVYVIDVDSASDDDYYETVWDVETRLTYSSTPGITDDDAGLVDYGDFDEAFLFTGSLLYYAASVAYPSSDEVDAWVSCSSGYGSNVGPWSDLTLSSGAFSVTCYADDEYAGGSGSDTYTVKPVAEGAGSSGTSLYYTTDVSDGYHPYKIQVVSYSVSDSRDNIGENVNIDVTLQYMPDLQDVTDGSITINGLTANYQGSSVWRVVDSEWSVVSNTYDTVACAGNDYYGVTGIDQNSQSTSVIWDRIQVQSVTPSDSRDDINDNVVIAVLLWYDYDNSEVETGSVTIQGITAVYSPANGDWRITENKGTVGLWSYNSVVVGGDDTYGISELDMNGQSCNVIWDRVQVSSYSCGDSRDNVDDYVTVDVTLIYDYDNAALTDGTVTVDGEAAVHQGSGVWRINVTSASVQSVTYDIVVVSGNGYGITEIDLNGQSQEVIWDRVQVQSYAVSDSRDSINDDVTIDATLYYDYDNSLVIDGTVTINGFAASHQGSGVWRITRTSATVTSVTYDTVACSGNTYGISAVDQNGQSMSVIWDRVQVQSYSVSDSRDEINDDVVINVTLWLDYDNTPVITGTVTINGYSATHLGSGVWSITRTSATVIMVTYNTVAASESTYGISAVDQNGQSMSVIWDRVQVQSYAIGDDRVGVGSTVYVNITLIYDYDNAALTDGTVTVNGYSATHLGSGIWRITLTSPTVQMITLNSAACSGNTYGISAVDQNGQSMSVIWDRIQVVSYAADDSRENINMYVLVNVTLIYDYDNTAMTDGTVTIDGESATHLGSGVWRINVTSTTVLLITYDVVIVSGNTYGITEMDLNGQSQEVIWDRVQVQSYAIGDDRVGVGSTVYVNITLIYDYDNAALTDGTVTVNGYSATHLGSGIWRITLTSPTVQMITLNSAACSGNTYGISAVDQNGQSETCIFDRVDVNLFISDMWTLAGLNVTITYNGTFEYDDAEWTGVPTLNSTGGTFYPGEAIAGNYTYIVLTITDPLYGILVFNESSVFCFFDGVVISSGPAYFWVQYSPTAVWLIWGIASSYEWLSNSSAVTDGSMVISMMNGTDNAEAATYGGSISGLAIGPFNSAWYHVNLTVVIDVGVTFLIWTNTLTVAILHSIHIEDSGMDVQDEWITFYFHTNWNNASFTIWDNVTGTPAEVGYSSSEGWYQITKPTVVGTHIYIILINGTHSGSSSTGQVCDLSINDSWLFRTYKFTVNPVTLSITDLIIMQNNESVILGGFFHTPSLTLTWNVTENGVLVDNGTIVLTASGNYVSVYWTKSTPLILTNFTFILVAGSSSLTIEGYSFVMDTTAYYLTYVADVYTEGDTLTNYYSTTNESPERDIQFILWTLGLVFGAIILGWTVNHIYNKRDKAIISDVNRAANL